MKPYINPDGTYKSRLDMTEEEVQIASCDASWLDYDSVTTNSNNPTVLRQMGFCVCTTCGLAHRYIQSGNQPNLYKVVNEGG